jgi:adenosylcobyric acid synthase
MPAKTLMIQGTASSVGKSIIVAALCRIFRQDGFKVAPFKAQNMALNSFVTTEGGEIGRAQAVQAEAAGIEPSVQMNPVLLKPEADASSQVIVLGKVAKNLKASQYYSYTPKLLKIIKDCLNHLLADYDIVVLEGAGSPAEINLKKREIVNMRVAKMANAPVLLVGDIDRGGVFASLIGTLELLTEEERTLIKGFIINKFRGDLKLLKPGLDILEKKTGKPVLGVIPYFRDITIAQEDSVYLDERQTTSGNGTLDIAVIRLPHISNYDDFDPLEERGCTVRYVASPSELGNPDLLILPGTKSTIADLVHLQQQGLVPVIVHLAQSGVPIIGICGGYQMLGRSILDPDKVESNQDKTAGLGLLKITTIFNSDKTTTQVKARIAADDGLFKGLKDIDITGYEIHMGQTRNRNCRPVLQVLETPQGKVDYFDGAVSHNGFIFGTYIHGLFHNAEFTRRLLNRLRQLRGLPATSSSAINKQEMYDKLADIIRHNLDMSQVYEITFGRNHG